MEAMNYLSSQKNEAIWAEAYYILTNILEPIIPHACWDISNKYFELENFKKPLEVKNEVFEKDSIVLAVTVNGKKRCEIEVALNSSNEEVLKIAKENAKKWLENSTIIKEIVVPNKLVNIVIKA